jgi:RNA polymerase sigma-70 factor (ECF subfamily)
MTAPVNNQITADNFKDLFDQYKNRLYGYVLTIAKSHTAAEEITQEIFIKLWLSRDLLSTVTNLDGYIFTIARHRTFNYLRKATNDARFLQELQTHMEPVENNNTDELIITKGYEKLVSEALEKLSPQRRKVYELSRHNGMNLGEIALHLGVSRNTVKNQLVDALASIRKYLTEHDAGTITLLLFMLY